jgi:anti-sigma B factor antagonist
MDGHDLDDSRTSFEVDAATRRPSPEPVVSVRQHRSGPWTIFVVAGDMDLQVLPLVPGLPDNEARRVVFDLDRVTFMDAAGLGVIVRNQQNARQAGGCVRLVAPSTSVRRILWLTGTDQAFHSFRSVHAAVSTPVLSTLAPAS